MGIPLGTVQKQQKSKGLLTLKIKHPISIGDTISLERETGSYTISELMINNDNIRNAPKDSLVTIGRMRGNISLGDKTIDIEDFSYYLTQISFQWEIINNLLIVGSAGTDSERIWIGNIGLEYTLFDAFFLRAGMRTDPLSPSLGVGYLFSAFAIDAATIYHPVLGMSVGVGLSFTF